MKEIEGGSGRRPRKGEPFTAERVVLTDRKLLKPGAALLGLADQEHIDIAEIGSDILWADCFKKA